MKSYSILCNESLKLGYKVYLPDNDSNNRLPLIVFLYGAGERGNGVDDLEKLALVGIPKYINEGKSYPAIILMPQCPNGMVWNNIIFALKKLIDKVVTEYNVDNNRISVTGLSMGGFGTWELGLSYPNYFSALAPICGGGLSWRCSVLKDTPIWAFHGDADNVVPLNNSVEMVDAVNKNGGKARLTILHKVGHNSWDEAYNSSNLIEWLVSQKRENT